MSQRMQYHTKRPYYQALNPIIQSQSPLSVIHCNMPQPTLTAAHVLCPSLCQTLNLNQSESAPYCLVHKHPHILMLVYSELLMHKYVPKAENKKQDF